MMKSFLLTCSLMILTAFAVQSSNAQTAPNVPWRYGLHLGANYNMTGIGYGLWAAELPNGSFVEKEINDGNAIGLYGGLNAQYMFTTSLGLQLRLSYDSRNLFAVDKSYGEVNNEFTFNNSYLSLEPSLVIYPLEKGFNVRVGAGLSLNMNSTYDYVLNVGSANTISRTGIENSQIATVAASAHLGFGYDINLSEASARKQWFLTPFIETSYLVGQRAVDFDGQGGFDDAMSTVTIRAGVAFAFGDNINAEVPVETSKLFRVEPPEDGIYTKRIVDEFYPIRPFVFFDRNNTEIPTSSAQGSRYVLLKKGETEDWDANSGLTVDDLSNLKARSYRVGEVYYNILNIAGSRLRKNKTATLTLIGSDPVEKNGDVLANNVKKYLVDVWEIDPARIDTKGQLEPRIPSGTARTPAADLPLVEMENRRVEFVYSIPSLGDRVQIKAEREANDENQIYLEITTNEKIAEWTVKVEGNGQRKVYGPFTDLDAYLDPTGLLGASQSSADFTAEVVAKTTDNRTLSETEKFSLKKATKDATAERHSLNFEYAEADPVKRSETFLRGEITNRVTPGSVVFINGHTDNIGSDDVNLKLSKERSSDVKKILVNELSKRGKTARVNAAGYGENPARSPFPNDLPEGRMYNRTVIIDVFPR